MFRSDLRQQLLEMRGRDAEKRDDLIRRHELHLGYHPEMEAIHVENASALEILLDDVGWPGTALVGDDGAAAAFLVALHAIGLPAFQRRCLGLIGEAAARRHAKPSHRAMLVDRIRFNERRDQVYGTIFDWDEDGEIAPWPIEDPDGVEARRLEVGLPPLADAIAEMRAQVIQEGAQPPAPFGERQAEIDEWARSVGWLA